MEEFIKFLQSNFGVAVGSILTIGFILVIIIARTKIGASSLKKVKNAFTDLKNAYDNKVEELKALKVETFTKLEEYKKEADYYKDIILEICDTIPNKKVKAIGERVRAYTSDEYLKSKIAEIDDYIEVKLDELYIYHEQLKDYYNGLKEKAQIKELEIYSDLQAKMEELTKSLTDYQTGLKTATLEEIEAFKNKYNEWIPLFEELTAKINEFKGE